MKLPQAIIFQILFICLTISTYGQNSAYFPTPDHLEWFKVIPQIDSNTPQWAITMYTDDSNYITIENQKNEYYRTHKWEKNIHTQNYKHWRKIVQNHIDEDGQANLPDPTKEWKTYEKIKAERKSVNRSSSNTWTNIGPTNTVSDGGISRTTQANIFSIGVAPSNTSVIYAGMETGGVFKSVDKGLSWIPSSESYAMGSPEDIQVDPLDEDIVYVVDGTQLYKTLDGGLTWNLHYTSADAIEQLYIHSTVTDTIYAATRGGLLKSDDAGATWSTIYTGYVYDIEAKPGTNDTLYISIKNDTAQRPEILISYDQGDNWTLKDSGFYSPSDISNATVYGCKIGVSPAAPDRIYAGIIASGKSGDNGWIGIYYSNDIGESWQNDAGVDGASIDNGDGTWSYPSGNDMNDNWYVAGYSSGYHQGWYNFDIDVSHNDADKLWIGTIWFCESANKGMNVEYIRGTRSLNMHADIQDIDVIGDDIWIASDGGLNYSNDECLTMETRMLGITASDYWGFGHAWNEDLWVGGRYHNGNAAFHENFGAGNTLFLGGAENATGYVNQFDNRKTYFSDVGAKRIPDQLNENGQNIPNLGLYPTESYFHFSYSEVEWHPNQANIVYVGKTNQLHRSVDGGSTFSPLYTFPGDIRRFEISRDDPNYIYAIVYHSYWDWRVYRSTDGGGSFSELTEPTLTNGSSWRELSLTLNPRDKDEIWLASRSSNDGNKIFSSTDGGQSWNNHYHIKISGQGIKDMIYHISDDGDMVYVMTDDDFYYYDIVSASWNQYNIGLPIQHKGFMILAFYRDNKIRMATAKGIWEVPFVNQVDIQANPMVPTDSLFCNRDTLYLESYSIVNQDGVSWNWQITPAPVYISDPNARNPKVLLGADGSYDITLTITHTNGDSDTRTLTDAVTLTSKCGVDPYAGKALRTYENGQDVVVHDANLTNITHFTITGWWKPIGPQQGFAAIVSSGDWCAHCDDTEGLIYDYFGSKLWYKWPGNASNWGSNSGMTIPQDEWSYVALVIEPHQATLYLNDQKYVHTKTLSPGDINNLYIGYGHYSKSFKGLIDEVTIWTTALSEEEVRRMRHITKENEVLTHPDLLAYYQFNEVNNGSIIMDKAGTLHGVKDTDADLLNSGVPVSSGSASIYDLSTVGTEIIDGQTKLYLSDCDQLEGQLVISQLDSIPYTLPDGSAHANQHWMVDLYSDSENMTPLDSIELDIQDNDFLTGVNLAENIILHTRPINSDGANWTSRNRAHEVSGSIVSLDRSSHIDRSLQIALSQGLTGFDIIDPGNPCEADTIAGQSLDLPGGSGNYAEIPALNLNSNEVSFSVWIKPDGIQNDWAGILFARGGSTTAGLSIRSDNELRYHWNGGEWSWSSGVYAIPDEWNHVVMVVAPTTLTLYLNGVPTIRTINHSAEEFDVPLRIGNDANSGSRTFAGDIDEVCIWNRILTQDEVRLLRHLTKDKVLDSDPDLVVYLQFNEIDGKIYDKTSYKNHTLLQGTTTRDTSTVPVGGGVSEIINVTGASTHQSPTGMDLTFGATGPYPDGELVLSRLNVRPDAMPGDAPVSGSYWIINNYGSNATFTAPTELIIHHPYLLTTQSTATQYTLYQRSDNDHGELWATIDIADAINLSDDQVTYDLGLNLTNAGQIIIDNAAATGWIGVTNNDWNESSNWGGGAIPILTTDVIIPKQVPYHPKVEIGVDIRSLLIQPDADFKVKESNVFTIHN